MTTNRPKNTARLNWFDRAVSFFSAKKAAEIIRNRAKAEFLNSYSGASKSRRSLKPWLPGGGDANADILLDLPTLRERSRDLMRDNPIAHGAIKTKITNIIGTGLVHHARIDREALGLTDEQADALESAIDRGWRLFWDTKNVDAARKLNGRAITQQVFEQEKVNGDGLALMPHIKRGDAVSTLKIQLVETDRLDNPNNQMDSETLAGGVEVDENGAPVAYHISDQHPGAIINTKSLSWSKVPAYGKKTGLPNVIHFYEQSRPGQSRGVPDLAPVIEPLKQLGRYTENELMATTIQSLYTVFLESEAGDLDMDLNFSENPDASSNDEDIELGNGAVVGLPAGTKANFANPTRPNQNFDPFFLAVVRIIGVGLQIPHEILVKHFTASYSASRGAILEFFKYVKSERAHVIDDFLSIVKEVWMYEEVAVGRIAAPGFLTDLAIRKAYLGAEWVGQPMGQLNEAVEVKAARERIDGGLSTIARETTNLTGGDWEQNHKQQVKENKARTDDGLIIEDDQNAETSTE